MRVKVFRPSARELGWVALHFECGWGHYFTYPDDEENRLKAIEAAEKHFVWCYRLNEADVLTEFLEGAYDRQLAQQLKVPGRNHFRLHLGRRRRA
jgi:hypothetical protein